MSKWKTVKLRKICEIVTGSTPSTLKQEYWDGSFYWVTPAEISDGDYYIERTQRKLTEAGITSAGLRIMPVGTVLLSSRAPIGKVAITAVEMACNQGFKNFVCGEKIHNRFLYYFLKNNKHYLNSLGRGATFKEISKSIVCEIEIPLPPLEEQKRIADILDKASNLIDLRKQQLEKMDLLIKSKFIDMFGDPVTNPKRWPKKTFLEVAIIDTNMTTAFEKYADLPHIGIDCIEKNTGKIISYQLIKESNLISGKYIFDKRHIIYSKIRPNLNKVALPSFAGLCSADAYPILPTESINRYFLAYIMRSNFFLDYILSHSDRTNIPKVNKAQLNSFTLPVPPMSLQNKFAEFVEQVEKQKAVMQQSLEKMEKNYKALMQEYF